MTISTTTSRASYNGNGVTTVFSVPFRFFQDADLVVELVTTSTGASTTLTLTTHYTVTGADEEAGGSLTMLTAPAVGERLVIRRVIAATQEVDYVAGDPFPAETHERALDRLTMLSQQGEEVTARALVFPSGDTASGEIPAVATRANKLLGFNSSGKLEVTAPASGSAAGLALDLASTASGKGAEMVAYAKAGRTVDAALDELPSTESWDGADALTRINAAIAATSDGVLRIPAGDYTINGDVLIQLKNNLSGIGPQGAFKIDATGARFSGAGNIIIDSCKRVQISGLDAPNHDFVLRGCWWSSFEDMRFRNLVLSDVAGTSFSANYWNQFTNCQNQAIKTGAASDFNNKFDFYSCSMRGNANQGFSGTADYAFEFNANANAQGWVFWGGDISYHNLAVYNVGAGNTDGDIELTFDGTYFDTLVPAAINRGRSRVQTKNCHYANAENGLPNSAYLPAVARGGQDFFRQDRSAAWSQFSGVNFVPNGDLRVGLASYVGAGHPIGSTGGATITAYTTAGLNGRYLNINQSNLGASGQVRVRPLMLPFNGRYTGVIVMRNADSGSRTMRLAFNDMYEVAQIKDSEWTLFTLTSGADLAAGAQPDIIIRANDDVSAFNVDVCYMAVTFGEGGMPFALASPHKILEASTTYDPPSIAAGASTSTTVSVPGAAFGDFVVASFGRSTVGAVVSALVSAADTVTVTFTNPTAGSIDPLSSTLRVRVWKAGYV